MEKFDFSGWATKNDLKCSDGRIIRHNAFKSNDGKIVPLVWNHIHNDPDYILGHALLENRDEGVIAHCSLNESPKAESVRYAIKHGDVASLSIYANQLQQNGSDVIHGLIREVSVVLAGANPGAMIENIYFAHSDEVADDEAIIYTGLPLVLEHSLKEKEDKDVAEDTKKKYDDEDLDEEEYEDDEDEDEEDSDDEEYEDDEDEDEEDEKKPIKHSDDEDDDEDGETIGDVLETLNEKQKNVVATIIGMAIQEAKKGEDEDMKHNVFDNEYSADDVLMHAEFTDEVIHDAARFGSMKESFIQHAAEYGIENIDWLQPEFKNINGDGAPGFLSIKPDDWVKVVMDGVHHTPFAKIKMMYADIREDEARAKGYIKGKYKKEEVFGLLKRQVSPTTVYKKQKFDREDVIDITDFDLISWVKGEMRTKLDEELARAFIYGDGRSALSEDKINEANIIPVWKDEDLFCIKYTVTPETGESDAHALINAAVKSQDTYEGSGNLVLFIKNTQVTDCLLLEDTQGHRMYKDINELALAMSVSRIVKVPASIVPTGVLGVMVDLKDYNVGADKGGSINMFEDFDIDYNQQKYLIETRCSACLIKPYSAIVLKAASNG